ncbi:ATP-binding cassette domain-containing protein [Caballeronia sp. GaOx3]|uniref:ATP-binding cassette domain-containing protein n=1 Tax=Caballeronia sp. GaOx3 TaxID=2921740 RepID=UPI002028070D|nr:ATP-binding cassette domain-containing protein [Caballeronia sp. GaOx3]
MNILTVQDLVVQTPTARLVDGVSFSVRAGRTLGLVGESGSGKSVTCLSVLGLPPRGVQVSEGRILFDGEDLRAQTPAQLNALRGREIGMILQDPMTSLNPLLTIGRQITEMFRYRDGIASRAERRARAIDLLRRVRIPAPESRLDSYPHQFSGGMRQRVAIAIKLGGKAQQLYADTTEIVRNKTVDSPLSTLAVAAGLGFVLGAIWATANATPSRSYPKRYRGDDQY